MGGVAVIGTRANLPLELNSFVGREVEVGKLYELVHRSRALTLCGAGGIGKTRLALRLLAEAADDFADGVWFVELADLRQPELIVSRIAAAIGVTDEPGRELLDTLGDALSGRDLLLAIDNCEHLIEACAQIAQYLLTHAPGLHILTTSREPLHIAAETVWQVPPLAVGPPQDEAIKLFAERAASSVPGFAVDPANVAAIAALCRALDGMPLAIELAAARVRALSLEQIRTRLTDRFGLLTTGDRTAPARQRTLRAAIEWSHELLTIPEQVLLRRLSVFASWSLEMAEEVCSDEVISPADMLDLMAALVDKSLMVREAEVAGEARYRMLDTIREYAAGQLVQAGEVTIFRHRLRDLTLRECERAVSMGMARVPGTWSERVEAFARFDAESGNIEQVLTWCLAERDAEPGLRICSAIGPCWLVRGTFAEGARWLDSFLRLDMSQVPGGVRGAALTERAQLALSRDPVAAEPDAAEGLELCREAGDEFGTAAALNLLSEIAVHSGRGQDAADYAEQALAAARTTGDGWNEGYALGTLAATAALAGRLREARELGESAVAAMNRVDQQWGVARNLLGLGDLARLRGDPADASRNYLRALPYLKDLGSRPETARCLAGLGRVAIDMGELATAREHLSESLLLSHHSGTRSGVARGLASFAALARAGKEPELAVRLIAAAGALRETAGRPPMPGSQTEKYLSAVRHLAEPAVARLWAEGRTLTPEQAVALALSAAPAPVPGSADAADIHRLGLIATPPGALTPREKEIVALIARGASNKAIADELFISPATAARHVANILTKLGFTSRAQIAAWAAAQPRSSS